MAQIGIDNADHLAVLIHTPKALSVIIPFRRESDEDALRFRRTRWQTRYFFCEVRACLAKGLQCRAIVGFQRSQRRRGTWEV